MSSPRDSTLRATSLFELRTIFDRVECSATFTERASAFCATCSMEAIISMMDEEVSSEVRARVLHAALDVGGLVGHVADETRDLVDRAGLRPGSGLEVGGERRDVAHAALELAEGGGGAALELAQAREHVVEGAVEVVDLVARARLDRPREIAFGHGAGRGGERHDGPADLGGDEEHDEGEGRGEGDRARDEGRDDVRAHAREITDPLRAITTAPAYCPSRRAAGGPC